MSTIGINLPDTLKAFVDQQLVKGEFRDASEFVPSLLEAEVQRQIAREVEQVLLEAADGEFQEWTEQDVEDIRRTGQRVIEERKRR